MDARGENQNAGAVRLRVPLGAAIVLVLAAAAIAVFATMLVPVAQPAAPAQVRRSATTGGAAGGAAGGSAGGVSTAAPVQGTKPVLVHVLGRVRVPGLYELTAGDRVLDAIAAAGGFTHGADQAQVNLARVVDDGEQIVVPAQGQMPIGPPAAGAGSTGAGTGTGAKVNINTADETALETLDGVGPSLAKRIIAFRTANGRFGSINDLLNVTGIGDKKFAAFKDEITI